MLSPVDIQHHLYSSFLDGKTADVALRVHGTWHAIYKLHRVVLIQSGFFRSLFTAGFAESSPRRLSSYTSGIEELNIRFDDRNITRAAFEVCISRLYGGGPPLFLDPSLVPTLSEPLTPSFPILTDIAKNVPHGHQPAPPCFLLSLLATSLYLSIPSIAAQALHLILNSVGPWTVLEYWRFATGRGINWGDEVHQSDSGIFSAAVGLENVAQLLDDDVGHGTQEDPEGSETDSDRSTSTRSDHLEIRKEAATSSVASVASAEGSTPYGSSGSAGPLLHYGVVSDKIGEAVVCWLARWGTDMFAYEKNRPVGTDSSTIGNGEHKLDRLISQSLTPLRKRATVVSNHARPSSAPGRADISPLNLGHAAPVIFGCGGLDAHWISALVSADTLFVEGERERYEFAKSIVEMRRQQGGVCGADEDIWDELFRRGIYYANMTMPDLIAISQDISPTTGRPYVALQVLQAAHWANSVQMLQITRRSSYTSSSSQVGGPSPESSSPRDLELGLSQSTAEIVAQSANYPDHAHKTYYPVHADASMRVGDSGILGAAGETNDSGNSMTMEQLLSMVSNDSSTAFSASASSRVVPLAHPSTTESTYFGLHPSFRPPSDEASSSDPRLFPLPVPAAEISSADPTGKLRWTPFPPHRFAVEFWDIDSLKEKSRLHSQTIWHAGSLFNVYVQVVRKKSPPGSVANGALQVGVYLHRQSSVEAIPGRSCPDPYMNLPFSSSVEHDSRHHRGPSLPAFVPPSPRTAHYSPSIHPPSRSSTPNIGLRSVYSPATPSMPSSPIITSFNGNSNTQTSASTTILPATSSSVAPQQPYRDPRPSVKAYFTICCASATGTAQTRFSSAPDEFAVSQSWGWKSSSLTLRVSSGVAGSEGETMRGKSELGERTLKKEVSLRATVVLGLV